MNTKQKDIILCGILCFFFLLSIPSVDCYAKEGEVIRIGYYPLENFHAEDANGNVTGYEVDYLNRIADRTGWTYEYVEADSWNHAIDMLRNGQIDMLSPAQITEERLQEFSYSASALGKVYGSIMTLNTNDFIYEDFEAFSNMKFGIEEGLTYNDMFAKYAEENHFTPQITIYKNHAALVEALNVGKIDAIVANIMRTEENMKLLGRFGTTSYYFMLRKEEEQLLSQLNQAMYQLDVISPAFQQELNRKYFPIYHQEPLTKAEIEYAAKMKTLTVGCPANLDPLSYIDERTGEVAGMTRDILEMVAQNSGLQFVYQALPKEELSDDKLRALGIDLLACTDADSSAESGTSLTNTYLQSQRVLIGSDWDAVNGKANLTAAIVAGSQTTSETMRKKYPSFEFLIYENLEEGLDAVLSKKADILLQDQYVANKWLQKPKYNDLFVFSSENTDKSFCLSDIRGESDSRMLISILNKGISNLDASELSHITVEQMTNRQYRVTLMDILYLYRYPLLALLFCLGIMGVIGCYTISLRQRNVALLLSSERRLANITNNINGGVLILEPNKELRLIYANEGFWNLLKYQKEENNHIQGESYIIYVHEDDLQALYETLDKLQGKTNQFSIRLRVRCKDGSYVPTMFNSTIADDEHGNKQLFCVIVDISKEVEIQEKLLLEEQKHHFLINRAKQIIYEIELEKNIITASEAFQEKFGWSLTGRYEMLSRREMLNKWRVYSDDQGKLIDMLDESILEHKDIQTVVRLLRTDGKFIWCQISQFTMLDSEKEPRMILGMIQDVDKEYQEKLRLKEKSERDSLTGLYNKEAFKKRCKKYLRSIEDENCALIFVDLDNFKSVNDTLGHMVGDQAIYDAAQKLNGIFSSHDLVARFGGDEFCILVKDVSEDALKSKLEWVVEKLRASYSDGEHTVHITSSVGATTAQYSGYEVERLLEHADTALYRSKEGGKNQYTIYKV